MRAVFIQVLTVLDPELFLNLKPQTLLHLLTHPVENKFLPLIKTQQALPA